MRIAMPINQAEQFFSALLTSLARKTYRLANALAEMAPCSPDTDKSAVKETKRTVNKHIFLAYCHSNARDVAKLRDELVAAGENVWWDKDILPGNDWKQEIRRAMKTSYAVVLCVSKELATRSKSGIYPEILEAVAAFRQHAPGSIFLIPVRLSKCEIPDIEIDATRTLDQIQFVDLFPASKREYGLKRLLQSLKAAPGHH